MSDSRTCARKSRSGETAVPRAVIHKKILDAAESRPDASMEAIAEAVNGANLSIVERVLDEYGDPASHDDESGDDQVKVSDDPESTGNESGVDETSSDTETDTDDGWGEFESGNEETHGSGIDADIDGTTETETEHGTTTDAEPSGGAVAHDPALRPSPQVSDLTEKQLETLREIRDRPEATQAELGDALGVTSATINQRVNTIDGFDWSERQEFVDTLFENEASPPSDERDDSDQSGEGADQNPEVESDAHPESSDSESKKTTITTAFAAESNARSDRRRAPVDRHANEVIYAGGTGESVGTPTPDEDDNENCTRDEERQFGPESIAELTAQVETLTRRFEEVRSEFEENSPSGTGILADPELAHKTIRACFAAEHISEDEELRIVKAMITGETQS